jgi:hypothetical protein
MTVTDVPGRVSTTPTVARPGAWTLERERDVLRRITREVGFDLPEESLPKRPPATAEERDRFYEHWTSVGALDLFIIESCAHGIALAPDPEFRLFLTRQIGDDGFHAQRFREQIEAVSGRDPLPDMVRESERQWEVFGDLSKRSWAGFLAFELHYELDVVPSMVVHGRKSTINDPRLVELSVERFTPDEAFHRAFVADWWRRHLDGLGEDERAAAVAELRALDAEGRARRDADLRAHWAAARLATGADTAGFDLVFDRWRQSVRQFLDLT